ncbi:hypothetical protein DRO30_02680 [Candidatus Bathyarchaeota archaeon]|nr:MAG: hypothetical protein DRO30_02680 [Candidatus Bathyarchaeota archaeon]
MSIKNYTIITWFFLLIFLDYLIPYLVLKNYPTIFGTFLFWCLLTILVALSCFILLLRFWRD